MDGAFTRLAFVGSCVGHLDTVVDAVPYQMHEGIVELVYDGLVEFGFGPFGDYLDLFPKFLRKVSDESFEFAEGAADRQHPDIHGVVPQLCGQPLHFLGNGRQPGIYLC